VHKIKAQHIYLTTNTLIEFHIDSLRPLTLGKKLGAPPVSERLSNGAFRSKLTDQGVNELINGLQGSSRL